MVKVGDLGSLVELFEKVVWTSITAYTHTSLSRCVVRGIVCRCQNHLLVVLVNKRESRPPTVVVGWVLYSALIYY